VGLNGERSHQQLSLRIQHRSVLYASSPKAKLSLSERSSP
jgi:hypothetical protein